MNITAAQPLAWASADLLNDVFDPRSKLRRLWDRLLGPMLAITQAFCTSFKRELLEGRHNFRLSGGHNFKIALYVAAATLDATTTAYTAANEVANGNGYTTTGQALTRVDPTTSGTVAFTDFADVVWTSASFTTRGALIYNADDANRACVVLDFGSDKTVTSGNLTVVFPTANSTAAIIRIA